MKTSIKIPPKPTMIQDLGMLFPTEKSKQKNHYGLFKCSCGKEYRAILTTVKKGTSKSCGCFNTKTNTKQKYIGQYSEKIDAAKAYDSYIVSNKLEHTKNF